MAIELPKDLESYFQRLTDITDNIASINTPYGGEHDKDFSDMDSFYQDIISRPWEMASPNYYELFTSYYTFHVKIIEEIIKEAREILDPDKKKYLKHLVNYKKVADDWFAVLKKKKKTSAVPV